MPRFASPHDGASIFYRDCVPEVPEPKDLTLIFLHSWPMSSRMWEYHLIKLCQDHGFRCIAPDRRGFGDSEWNGRRPNDPAKSKITYDTFADDVIFLLEDLEVGNFVFVGGSMGTAESLLCYERSPYVQDRCKGFVWMGCNIPYPIKSIDNPTAPTVELWNEIISGLRDSRPDYVANALPGIFGIPAGVSVPKEILQNYERIIAQADGLGMERTNKILVERDFTPEVTRLGQQGEDGVKVLIVHGDSDTSLPYEASASVVKKLVPRAEMKIYEKAAHEINVTHAEQFLNDILAFTASIETEKST